MSSTPTDFELSATLKVYEPPQLVFSREYSRAGYPVTTRSDTAYIDARGYAQALESRLPRMLSS